MKGDLWMMRQFLRLIEDKCFSSMKVSESRSDDII
jgi:hypothetical protein